MRLPRPNVALGLVLAALLPFGVGIGAASAETRGTAIVVSLRSDDAPAVEQVRRDVRALRRDVSAASVAVFTAAISRNFGLSSRPRALLPRLKAGLVAAEAAHAAGRYRQAIELAMAHRQQLDAPPPFWGPETKRYERTLLRLRLVWAHALWRTGQKPAARKVIHRTKVLRPRYHPNKVLHAPDVIEAYGSVPASRAFALTVRAQGASAIFVDGRRIEAATPQELPEGKHQVIADFNGVRSDPVTVELTRPQLLAISRPTVVVPPALVTAPFAHLRFSSARKQRADERRLARAVGQRLSLRRVYLLSYRGSKLEVVLFNPAKKKLLWRRLVPAQKRDRRRRQLARVAVELRDEFTTPDRTLLVVGGIAIGTGLAVIASSVPLFLLDGECPDERQHCPERYDTAGAGFGLAIGGGIALAAGIGMLVAGILHRENPRAAAVPLTTVLVPLVSPRLAGATLRVAF